MFEKTRVGMAANSTLVAVNEDAKSVARAITPRQVNPTYRVHIHLAPVAFLGFLPKMERDGASEEFPRKFAVAGKSEIHDSWTFQIEYSSRVRRIRPVPRRGDFS